ncbi:hypothetical protein HJFPF1_05679 [Paramyrothecium foliicola]|nr:hypothetical protein HJFPF1_05679 [Paramyrothecium foliicola]
MAENTTTSDQVDNVATPEMVSGWSIFWALVAIVTYAMQQVSFTGHLCNGDTFQGYLWPHRSSPFVCLIDGAADAYLGFQAFCDRDPSVRDRDPHPGRNGILPKLALFSLGVLPQAIKLFGMRGIPVTQAIAGMYMLASICSLVRSLCSRCPERDLKNLLQRLEKSTYWIKEILNVYGWVPHFIGTYLVWCGLVPRIAFSASGNIANAIDWFHSLIAALISLQFQARAQQGESQRGNWTYNHCNGCGWRHWVLAIRRRPVVDSTRSSIVGDNVGLEDLAPINRTEVPAYYQTAATQTATQDAAGAHSFVSESHENIGPQQQQPIASSGQAPRPTNNGDVDSNRRELRESTNAAVTSSAPVALLEDESQDEESWYLWVLGPVTVPVVLLSTSCMIILGIIFERLESGQSGDAVRQQNAAEEGTVSPSVTNPDRRNQVQDMASAPLPVSHQLLSLGRSGLRALGIILRRVLNLSSILIRRLTIGIVAPYFYLENWVWRKVTAEYPTRILANAFGLLNFSMVVLYYLVFFDGDGTSAPAWLDVLG